MTRYQKIVNLGEEFLRLVNAGLISCHLLDWKVYYEAYLNQLELQRKQTSKNKKTEAVATAAVHYDISKRQMFNIIAYMEGLT